MLIVVYHQTCLSLFYTFVSQIPANHLGDLLSSVVFIAIYPKYPYLLALPNDIPCSGGQCLKRYAEIARQPIKYPLNTLQYLHHIF